MPDISDLCHLHTVIGTFRNENAVDQAFDYSAFEWFPGLKRLDSVMAVDRHRIPAEGLLPVLRNQTVERVTVTSMYKTEDRKLVRLMEQFNPGLIKAFLRKDDLDSIDEFRHTVAVNFAW